LSVHVVVLPLFVEQMTHSTMTLREKTDKAYNLGYEARKNETATAPCQDKVLMNMISGAKLGEKWPKKVMNSWVKGFEKAHKVVTDQILKEQGVL